MKKWRKDHFLFGVHPDSKLNKPEVGLSSENAFEPQDFPTPNVCICNTLPLL